MSKNKIIDMFGEKVELKSYKFFREVPWKKLRIIEFTQHKIVLQSPDGQVIIIEPTCFEDGDSIFSLFEITVEK